MPKIEIEIDEADLRSLIKKYLEEIRDEYTRYISNNKVITILKD